MALHNALWVHYTEFDPNRLRKVSVKTVGHGTSMKDVTEIIRITVRYIETCRNVAM